MSFDLNNQTTVMRRYLLGELPEPEQLALEEQFFADEAMADQMRTVEQEIVDAYVRGRLGDEEKTVFERNYLAAPRHVERVAFARELLRIADETPVEQVPRSELATSPSFWTQAWSYLSAPRFSFAAVAAMGAIVAAGVLWILLGRLRAPNQQAPSQAQTIQQNGSSSRASEERIARLEEENHRLSAEIEKLQNPREPSVRPSLASILLLPTSRASQQQTLRLDPDDKQARLQMKIVRGTYVRYQVDLQPVDGGASWRSSVVSARRSGNDLLLSVLAPAGRLAPGDYTLTLTGVDAAGSAEAIEYYSLRVVHR
jgi:anti-sigma factor RsiW